MPAKRGQVSSSTDKKSVTESKPNKGDSSEIDKKKDKEDIKVDKGDTKKASLMHLFSKAELKALRAAKAAGGDKWEKARKQAQLKMRPLKSKPKTERANTAMPVRKLKRRLQETIPRNKRVTTEAAVALASVLDYAVSELLDNAMQAADVKKAKTITARHIRLGVPQDESLAELFKGVTIPQGGTVPTFHPELAMGYRRSKRAREASFINKDGASDDEKVNKESSSPAAKDKATSHKKDKDKDYKMKDTSEGKKKTGADKAKDSADDIKGKGKDDDMKLSSENKDAAGSGAPKNKDKEESAEK